MRDGKVQGWLNEMSWAMGGTLSQQQAARDELRAHIAALAREHELQGVPPDEAISRALAELGDATVVGRAMRSSRGSEALRRPLVQPEGAPAFGPRRVRNMPPALLMMALAAAPIVLVCVAAVWMWG